MKEIFTRRSVRNFTDKEIEKESMDLILKAAISAPSARNQEPWEFVVVKDKKNIERLSQMSAFSKFVTHANAIICIVSRPDEKLASVGMVPQDVALAMENMMLEACHLGIGSCYLGVFPIEERMEFLRHELSIPEGYKPMALLALGYPAEKNAFHEVERDYSARIHKERF